MSFGVWLRLWRWCGMLPCLTSSRLPAGVPRPCWCPVPFGGSLSCLGASSDVGPLVAAGSVYVPVCAVWGVDLGRAAVSLRTRGRLFLSVARCLCCVLVVYVSYACRMWASLFRGTSWDLFISLRASLTSLIYALSYASAFR